MGDGESLYLKGKWDLYGLYCWGGRKVYKVVAMGLLVMGENEGFSYGPM